VRRFPGSNEKRCKKLKTLLSAAWKKIVGSNATAAQIDQLLPLISVLRADVGGPYRAAAIEIMAHVTENQLDAPGAFGALEQACQALMVGRLGAHCRGFRARLAQTGTRLNAPPRYQEDVERLRK
jgi:hypothetical protein